MDSSEFQFQFIHLNSVNSTNIYAFELLNEKSDKEGVVVTTDFQESGKGQLGQVWESERAKNLQFSIIVSPKLAIERQFELSQLVAVSLKQWLDTLAVGQVKIKWPNDILVNDKKIAGVLIENSIQGQLITNSVIGIGVNVNQTIFSEFLRAATSLRIEKNENFNREKILQSFLAIFQTNYFLHKKSALNLKQLYLNSLFAFGAPHSFEDKLGKFLGVIIGVLPSGKLQVNRNGKLKTYDLKEIKFLV